MKNLQSLASLKTIGSRSGGATIIYLLQDTFSTDLAAGAVNGTQADIGGVRTVTDTLSGLSISGGQLVKASAVNTAAGDPGIWWPSIVRAAGRMILGNHISGNYGNYAIGFDANQAGLLSAGLNFQTSGVMRAFDGTNTVTVGVPPTGTVFFIAVIQRSTGYYYFIKEATDFPKWTLLWISSTNNTTPMFPNVATNTASSNAFTFDNIRVPSNLYLPVPLAYDTFGRANGSLGSTEVVGPDSQGTPSLVWTGSTWTVASNVAVNTPVTLGAELFTDPGLEAWTSATNATSYTESLSGTSTVNQETSVVHGGSNAARLDVDGSNSSISIAQTITTTVGKFYLISYWAKASTTGKSLRINGAGLVSLTTSYVQYFDTFRATASTLAIAFTRSNGTSASLYVDDVSGKEMTTSELFSSITTSTKDIIADVNVTHNLTAYAGLVVNLDDATTPANFVIAYLEATSAGYNAVLIKCVAGTYTSVISAAVTYSAGATLRVIKDGTSYQLFYNNAKVGSTSTISDAGIISNTKHGLFSTHLGNSLDNFLLFPRGSSFNEWAALDAY